MDITGIKQFLDGRKAGGIGEKDLRELVDELAIDGAMSAAQKARLETALSGYRVTDSGAATLQKLTGLELHRPSGVASTSGSSALDVRAGSRAPVPRQWDRITRPAPVMKRLIAEGESVKLRLSSGRVISLEADDSMIDFLRKGFFELYKNARDSNDYDDNGRTIAYAGWYLVPTPAMKVTEDAIEKHSKTGDRVTKEVSAAMERLHRVMHASNVGGLAPHALKEIKAKVYAEIPKAKAAIIAFEAARQQFARDTQGLPYPDGGVFLTTLAREALNQTGPRVDGPSMCDPTFVKDLIRASELLLPRCEILSVDPGGDGIRVEVDTNTLVANGGDLHELRKEIDRILKDALITGDVSVCRRNNEDAVMAAAMKSLEEHVGKVKVADCSQIGDKYFPDGVRGTEVKFWVAKDELPRARAHAVALEALFIPHGFDPKHFVVTIEEAA